VNNISEQLTQSHYIKVKLLEVKFLS